MKNANAVSIFHCKMLKETKFTIELAKKAGKILLDNLGKIKFIREKSPSNLVTNVDLASERIIIKAIKNKFPKHGILSEEFGEIEGSSEHRWLIDPLDGTHNYIHRFPLFGVSIALELKKEVILGVIYMPTLNQIFFAEKGKGAFLNNKKIHVSKIRNLRDSMVSMDSAFYLDKELRLKTLAKLIDKVFRVRLPGAAVFELTAIAQGITTAHISFCSNPWDVASGFLMITESGGKITDLSGNKADHYCKEFIVSNGLVHEGMLKVLR